MTIFIRRRVRGIIIPAYSYDPRVMLLTEAGPQIEDESGDPLEVEDA